MTTGTESLFDARSIEAIVEKVRVRLDYPEINGHAGYIEAVESLDRLASLAHETRRVREVIEKVGVVNALRGLVEASEPLCGKLEVVPGRAKLPPEYYPAASPNIRTLREAVAVAKGALDGC